MRGYLTAARLRAGLTQRQLAAALGTTQARIARVELGERRMDLPEVYDWLVATGADPLGGITDLIRQMEEAPDQRRS